MTSSEHERKFVRVYWVHLTVVNDNSYVASVATCQRTRLHALHDTLEDSRHEASIDSTTYYRVDEYQLATPLEVHFLTALDVHLELLTIKLICCWVWHTLCIWLYDKVNFTKLSGTTTLLLMTIFGTSHLGDSFTIRNLRFTKLHLNLLVVLQTPLQSTEVELTLTMNDSLAQLLRLLNNPCWVFLAHLKHSSHKLLCFS